MSSQREADEIERYKGLIKEMLKRVPASINSGGYNTAVRYKEICAKAYKILGERSPKYVAVRSIYSDLNKYHQQTTT